MRVATLELLRCPYCGSRLTVVENAALRRTGDQIESGVLGCECCAFPIVEAIPVLIAADPVRQAMHQLEAGDIEAALATLLELEGDRATAFRRFRSNPEVMTYRAGLGILSQDAEAEYFVYRFSDPTFRLGRAVLLAAGAGARSGPYLDLCGGSGHLTRSMISDQPTVLADVHFWKLWLAKTFVAPHGESVCCDANHPLPFTANAFSLVVLSDAFPYIWHKRLLADEMMRVAGPGGTVVMPHLHSSLGWNYSAGMPLTPAAYRNLFERQHPRLFRDSQLLDQVLAGYVDLSHDESPEALGGEPALVLVATSDSSIFRRFEMPLVPPAPDTLVLNPLYRVERRGDVSLLTLTFPTPEYADEFGAVKRYLPESLTLPGDLTQPIDAVQLGDRLAELCRRCILISAPAHYL